MHTIDTTEVQIIKPLANPVEMHLSVSPGLINFSKENPMLQVFNASLEDVWLKPGTRIALAQPIQEIISGKHYIDIVPKQHGLTIEAKNVIATKDKSKDHTVFSHVDLSRFKTESERSKITELLKKVSDVFMKKREELVVPMLRCTKLKLQTMLQSTISRRILPIFSRGSSEPPQ